MSLSFAPGETEKPCVLELMDDDVFEDVEELRLVLGTPQSSSAFGAAVGEQNETLIRIQDDADSKKSLPLLNSDSGTEGHSPPPPTPEFLGGAEKYPLFFSGTCRQLRHKKTSGEQNSPTLINLGAREMFIDR